MPDFFFLNLNTFQISCEQLLFSILRLLLLKGHRREAQI